MTNTCNAIGLTVTAVLGMISLYCIVQNGIILVKRIRKTECPSVMPFVGGVSGVAAILLLFEKQYWGLAFIPLIIDYGSIPTIIRFIYYFISDWVIEKNKGDKYA